MSKTYVTKNKLDVLEWIAQLGLCYRSDFVRCISFALDVSTQYAGRLLTTLEKDGLVVRYETKRDNRDGKNDTYDVVKITAEGWKLLENKNSYYIKYHERFERAVHTSDASEVRKMCTDARVRIMFFLADIPTFLSSKPSLYHLYNAFASPADGYHEEYDHKPLYQDDASPAECKNYLNNGIYYTIAEVREFLNEDSPGQADVTYVSRARGIFISNTNLFIVYTCQRGNNKMLYLRSSEKNIIDAIRQLIKITNVRRIVPELSASPLSPFSNDVDALVVSDSDAIVYAMVMGHPHGTIKSTSDQNKTKPKWKKNFLDAENEDYARIYVTPYTSSGVGALSYICKTSAEQYHADSVDELRQISNFTANSYDPLYPYDENDGQKIPAIFFPAYEVKELNAISKAKGSVAIVTYDSMVDTIAHSLRKEAHYYDADTLQKIDPSRVTIYDSNGKPKGYNMVAESLQEFGFVPDNAKIVGLAKSYGLTPSEFFNKVATGEIFPDDAITKLDISKLKSADILPTPKAKMVQVSFFIPEDLANDVKKAAKGKDTSVSGYLKALTVEQSDRIHEDAEKYKEHLRELRRTWKK